MTSLPMMMFNESESQSDFFQLHINPFTIWWIFVLCTGIAVVSGTTRARAMMFWAGVVGGGVTLLTMVVLPGVLEPQRLISPEGRRLADA